LTIKIQSCHPECRPLSVTGGTARIPKESSPEFITFPFNALAGHIFGTRTAEGEPHPKDIQEIMDHAHIATTMRYLHATDTGKLRAIAAAIVSESDALYIDERWLAGRRSRPRLTALPQPCTPFAGTLATREKDAIEEALAESKGRVSGLFGAAARLGIPSSTLESKIKALKIDKRLFKPQSLAVAP
jgi:hypothetical protein